MLLTIHRWLDQIIILHVRLNLIDTCLVIDS
jgi:hypothetical protein